MTWGRCVVEAGVRLRFAMDRKNPLECEAGGLVRGAGGGTGAKSPPKIDPELGDCVEL